MRRAHVAALVMWAVAGLFLVTSLVLGSWWAEGGMRVGLASFTACADAGSRIADPECVTRSFSDPLGPLVDGRVLVIHTNQMFVWAGRATFVFCIGLVAAITACSVLLARKQNQLGYLVIFVATILLGVSAVAFIVSARGGMSVGASFYLTFAAIALAFFGCFARAIFPIPEPMVAIPRPGPKPRRFAIAPGTPIVPPIQALGARIRQERHRASRPPTAPPLGPWSYAQSQRAAYDPHVPASPDRKPDSAYAPPPIVRELAARPALACPRCESPTSSEVAPFCDRCHAYLLSG